MASHAFCTSEQVDATDETTALRILVLAGNAVTFAPFCFKHYVPVLKNVVAPYIAIGAMIGETPVGLAFGHLELQTPDRAQLISILVQPFLRCGGIGSRLLAAWETVARSIGARGLVATHTPKPVFEALLKSNGWTAPRLAKLQVVGEAQAMVSAGGAWRSVQGKLASPDGFSFENWQIRDGDAEAIARLSAQSACIAYLEPQQHASRIEPEVSIAIRRDGALTGWVLGERMSYGMGRGTLLDDAVSIHYFAAYCDEALAKSGLLIGGYFHAFARQAASFGPKSRAVYVTSPSMPGMLALTQRRFAAIAERVDEIFTSRKALDAGE